MSRNDNLKTSIMNCNLKKILLVFCVGCCISSVLSKYSAKIEEEKPILLGDVEALSSEGDAPMTACFLWKNRHIPFVGINPITKQQVVYPDSVRGESDSKFCDTEEKMKEAKEKGYTSSNSHMHDYMNCKTILL